MSVVVTSCGRSGTNMVLEILTGNSFFKPTEPAEDKLVFRRSLIYPTNYLTKCDTVYYSFEQLRNTMNRNIRMKLIWTIRDPRDMIMSKFRRGVPKEQGGDCKRIADDATSHGAIKDIQKMLDIYINCVKFFKDRIMLIKMEDALLNTEKIAKSMCNFIGIKYVFNMILFWNRMRVEEKKKRYSGKDLSQIEMYKHWRDIYGGWFIENKIDMESIFDDVKKFVKYFEYKI